MKNKSQIEEDALLGDRGAITLLIEALHGYRKLSSELLKIWYSEKEFGSPEIHSLEDNIDLIEKRLKVAEEGTNA